VLVILEDFVFVEVCVKLPVFEALNDAEPLLVAVLVALDDFVAVVVAELVLLEVLVAVDVALCVDVCDGVALITFTATVVLVSSLPRVSATVILKGTPDVAVTPCPTTLLANAETSELDPQKLTLYVPLASTEAARLSGS
jgi:hypothetical protein